MSVDKKLDVIGKSAPAIPNINRAPLIACEVEWKNKSSKNEMAVITIPGINNFRLSPILFATNNPKTGPKIIIDKPKASCRNPTFSGSSPNPEGGGADPNCGMPVITKYCKIPNINIMMFPVKITG